MERLERRLGEAAWALQALDESVRLESPSDYERDFAIGRFEFSLGAVCEALRTYLLEVEGLRPDSPRAAVRMAGEIGLLDSGQVERVLEAAGDLRKSVRPYDDQLALEIYHRLESHAEALRALFGAIRDRAGPGR